MDDKDKGELFIKENSTIFKKYKVKKKLGEGAFGDVYLGSCVENNELVAIKVEQRKILKPLLETEAFFLYSLRGLGIPEVLSFGRLKKYNVLVEPLLDKSLFDIFVERRKKLPLEDICLIAKQIIDRIQWVHSKYIVHRDIKPDNFLIGRKDPNIIYLIDFGLSKKYKSSTTGKHIKFNFTGKLTGTVRFASANALRGGEQSRRDDLESIGYMLIYFMRGKLPWQGVTGNKKMERYLKIYKMKKNVAPEDLCKSLPHQMTEFMRYVKSLEFEQDPNYNHLRNLFNSILKKINGTNDQLIFSWIRMADLPNLKNPANPATRRDSPQSRLYRKIQQSLDKDHKRNISSDNDSGQNSFQTCTVTMNTNIGIIKNNSKDTDIETNNNKMKMKEGLNTTVANLNKTLDENILGDFDKPSSNDFGEVNINPGIEDNSKKMKEKKESYTVDLDYKKEKNKNEKQLILSSFSSHKNKTEIQDKSEEKKRQLEFDEKKIEVKPLKLEDDINYNKNKNLIQKNNDHHNNFGNNNDHHNMIGNNNDNQKIIGNNNDNQKIIGNNNDNQKIIGNNNDNHKNIGNNNDNHNIIGNNNENSNVQQFNDKNLISDDENLNNKKNEDEHEYEHDNENDKNIFNKKNMKNNLHSSINNKSINENNQFHKNDIEINNKYNKQNNEINHSINNFNNEIKTDRNNKDINNNINVVKESDKAVKNNNIINNNINNRNNIINNINYENNDINDINDIKKTISNKIENKLYAKIDNSNDKIININEIKKEYIFSENKKYNKNNTLMKQLSNKNNHNKKLKEEILNLNNNNKQIISEKNNVSKEFINNNNINEANLTNYNNNITNNINENNKEEPNDNDRKKNMMKKIKKIKSQISRDQINFENKENHTTSSKNINRYLDNFDNSLKRNNKNVNNFINPRTNVKINGRKVPNNIRNNFNFDDSKMKTEIYPNNNYVNNFEILPKNSDDVFEQKDNQFLYKNEDRNQNNIMKLNMNQLNDDNTIKKKSNINSNMNSAQKRNGNINNLYQKNRINSNNKSSEKNRSNEKNIKNKTLPNFTENNNIYNNEVKIHPNVKKKIINRTKNMKNINYYSSGNKNYYSNINNLNLMPNDNNEFMNSIQKNRMRQHESNSIDRIDLNNGKSSNKRNQINMNINNNINNNIIINNNINNNNMYGRSNEIIRNNSKNNYQGIDSFYYLLNKRPSYNVKNNIHSFNDLNQMEINKRPSYNIRSNNMNFYAQIGVDNRLNYTSSNLMNNNNTPISGGYTKIKKLNNNTSNRMQTNLDINNNTFQENQLNQLNQLNPNTLINQSNTMRENQFMNNKVIDNNTFVNPIRNLTQYNNVQNQTPDDTQENEMSLIKKKMLPNNNFYLTENNLQKNRNISAEIKDKKTLFLEQYQNNYVAFQNQLNNINLYENNNNNMNNNMNLYNYGNYI